MFIMPFDYIMNIRTLLSMLLIYIIYKFFFSYEAY